jgi:hypothetical protein
VSFCYFIVGPLICISNFSSSKVQRRAGRSQRARKPAWKFCTLFKLRPDPRNRSARRLHAPRRRGRLAKSGDIRPIWRSLSNTTIAPRSAEFPPPQIANSTDAPALCVAVKDHAVKDHAAKDHAAKDHRRACAIAACRMDANSLPSRSRRRTSCVPHNTCRT